MQSLLSQSHQVYASATSPLLEYWYGSYGNFTLPEVKSQDADLMKKAFVAFCREGAKGYYETLTNRPVVVDKSRGHLEYSELLWEIYPQAKIICMVRDVEDIVASLERIYRVNPGHPETRDLPKRPDQRAQHWVSSGSFPLGLALDRIRNRQAKGADDRILYVNYDNLVDEPVDVMKQVFEYMELDPIEVDPMNVRKSVKEDDSHYGIFGSHELRARVERLTPKRVKNKPQQTGDSDSDTESVAIEPERPMALPDAAWSSAAAT